MKFNWLDEDDGVAVVLRQCCGILANVWEVEIFNKVGIVAYFSAKYILLKYFVGKLCLILKNYIPF